MSDDAQIQHLISIATSTGDPEAAMNVGIAHNMRGDLDEAFDWWIRSAEAGNARAASYLGWIYKIMDERERAVDWTRRAAAAGEPNAQQLLKTLSSDEDITSEHARALTLSAKTLAESQMTMGLWEQALNNLTIAANGGDIDADFKMGQVWEQMGTLGHAILFYERAGRHGHPEAMYRVGRIFSRRGDVEAANGWCSLAAAAGDLDAKKALSECV